MGAIIVVLTLLMHLSVYWAGHRLAYNPSLLALIRNVVFIQMFVLVIGWLQRRFNLQASRHIVFIALLLTSIGLAFQYRISYDIWASSTKSSIAIANKRRFLRDKINILFVRQHPESAAEYTPPDSPHSHISLADEATGMLQTLAKMSIVLIAFVAAVVLQMRGKLEFLEANYLFLGVMTFIFTILLGGVTAAFGGASGGGSFLAQMTPWEVLKIPLVLTMTGFMVATQPYFGKEEAPAGRERRRSWIARLLRRLNPLRIFLGDVPGGDRLRFSGVMLLLYLSPLWIFILIRDFGQLWIMTFFYTLSFYVSTRRPRFALAGLGLVVVMFGAVLWLMPMVDGLAAAIIAHDCFGVIAAMGAAAIAGIYVLYVRMTARGSPAKLALVVAGMAGWFFVSFAMPPYMITLFGAGDTNPIRISRQFVKLPAEEVTRFLQHAPSLTRRLSTVLGLPDSPDSLAYDIRQMPTDEIERRLSGWRMFHTYGSDSTQADRIAVVLRTWPRDELRCLLRASPRFRARLGTQLGLGSAARPASMVDKIRRITPESLVARLGSMGTWEPPPSLGVLATPWRRITSWWRMWGLLIGERSELLDESGPYWRTLDHLFRGFFAMEHGGWVGQGMGIGFPVFVPKAINDFMYAALCEELGWLGAAAILLLYTALIWTIVVVGQHSTNNYWRLVTINFAILFWAQVFVNVGGVVGFIPLTGIPLPFISRGFFSMLTSFTALGILVGISHGSAEATKRKG